MCPFLIKTLNNFQSVKGFKSPKGGKTRVQGAKRPWLPLRSTYAASDNSRPDIQGETCIIVLLDRLNLGGLRMQPQKM